MNNKLNAKVIKKAAKRLSKVRKAKPTYIEVESPKVRTDFLLNNIGTNKETIIDKFKSKHVKPTLLL